MLTPNIETVGYVVFDQSKLWQTNVRVAGWVESLYVHAVGEPVVKGQVLFTLYSPAIVKAQEEMLNAYRTGRKTLINGAIERLVALGVDRQQIRRISRTGRASQTVEIKASANGIVASLAVREGSYLLPAQTAMSVGSLETVWVESELLERQAHWVQVGSDADMTLDAIPNQAWRGKVEYIYPILDPLSRTLKVRLVFANLEGELKPNMFANVNLQPAIKEQVLLVPNSAVIRSGGMARVVLSEGEGQYRSARIEVGREALGQVEVLEGLKEGDRIVTSAHFLLDSESSQSADFTRINGHENSVWVLGTIQEVMIHHRMLSIAHQPVPEWDWPGMTMNFMASEELALNGLQPGQQIEFKIQKTDQDQFEILEYKNRDLPDDHHQAWVNGKISTLLIEFGMVTVSHDAVPKWNWQAGEMNFTAGEDLELNRFSEGQSVRFLVEKQGSDHVLKALESAKEEQ